MKRLILIIPIFNFMRSFLFFITRVLMICFAVQLLIFNCQAQDNRIWSTYLGSSGNDGGFSVCTDDSGNVYMAGITSSTGGIAYNGFQMTYGGGNVDAYLAKYKADGTLLWATYYGGEGNEMTFFGGKLGITADSEHNVYLAGLTNSTTGIAANGFLNTIGGTLNAFLVKFDPGGGRVWATYYGGTFANGYAVAVDKDDNVYMTGATGSTTGIYYNGFDSTWDGSNDAYLVKFDPQGNRIWATYYGGASMDEGYCVTTDANNNVYLAGHTYSTTGIASGGFQNTFGGGNNDAFLVKFDSSGARQWATYFGGPGDELFMYSSDMGITTDAAGNVYLTGVTSSTTGIAYNGFQNSFGGGTEDAFLVKFDGAGNRLWATYYGDNDDDKGYSVSTDNAGNVLMGGRTLSAANIASAGFQNTYGGGQDAFLVKFTSAGERLCATYYGGIDVDDCNSIAADGHGNVYLAGTTSNATGIAVGGHQTFFGGGSSDGMLIKFTSICGTTQVENVSGENNVEVFPNPAGDYVVVKSDENIIAIEVFDNVGRVVCNQRIEGRKGKIDLQSLAPGVYNLKITLKSENLLSVKKLIIEE
jgi:hypothetical protein